MNTLYLGEVIAQQLPLPEGLRALSQELRPGRASRSLARLAAEVSQGRGLTDALDDVHSELPHDLRLLMLSGAQSGRLVEVMERYAAMRHKRRTLHQELWSVLAYPLSVLALIVLMGWLNWRLMTPVFAELRLDTAASWVGIMWLMGPVLATAVGLMIGAGLLLAATWRMGGRRVAHAVRRAVPLIGPLFRFHTIREFAELLGLFVRYGVPLAAALRHTAAGVHDASCEAACRQLAAEVERGTPLGKALSIDPRTMLAPLAPMVAYGEQHGLLADSLDTTAEMYRRRAEVQSTLLQGVGPPLLILMIAAAMGLLLMAFLWPLFFLLRILT